MNPHLLLVDLADPVLGAKLLHAPGRPQNLAALLHERAEVVVLRAGEGPRPPPEQVGYKLGLAEVAATLREDFFEVITDEGTSDLKLSGMRRPKSV